jgi:hypothetical protein
MAGKPFLTCRHEKARSPFIYRNYGLLKWHSRQDLNL